MGNGTNKGQGQMPPNSGANAVSKDQTPAKQTLRYNSVPILITTTLLLSKQGCLLFCFTHFYFE